MTPTTSKMNLPKLKVSEDARSLVTEKGDLFFYLADTAWELFHRLTLDEPRIYLEDRARKGFNISQAVALGEINGLTTPTPNGHLPLKDLDPTKPLEPYWAHVDQVIDMANDLGLYIAFLPTWGEKWQSTPVGWGGVSIFNPDNARLFGRWLGKRYRDKGIIWVLGGDRPVTDSTEGEIIRQMAHGLAEGDAGNNLMTFHPPGGQSSSKYVHAESWLDFHMQQTGHDRGRESYKIMAHDWELQPPRPFVNGEPVYEAHPNAFKQGLAGWSNHHDVRRELYWSICEGAAGFAYGVHSIWQFYDETREGVNAPRATWKKSLDLPGSTQMQVGAALAHSRPFLNREPAWQHLKPRNGIPGMPPTATARACRDKDGSWAFIYLPIGQSIRIDLAAMVSGLPTVTWIDPRTGKGQPGELPSYTDPSDVFFTPPHIDDPADWILVLDRASQQYPPIENLLSSDKHSTNEDPRE